MMKIAMFAVLALAGLISGIANAQECEKEFAALESQIQGAKLQADYKGKEASHPLVLAMESGELVDLTGQIVTATPYESWAGDKSVVDKVNGYLTEAKSLSEAKKEQECLALLTQARKEIQLFNENVGGAAAPAEAEQTGDSGNAN